MTAPSPIFLFFQSWFMNNQNQVSTPPRLWPLYDRIPAVHPAIPAAVAVGAAWLLFFLIDPATQPFLPPCLFHAFTGLHCPGCGATRALHQIANGNLVAALKLNALVVLGLPLGCLIVIRRKRHDLPAWCLRTLFIGIVLFGFARNIPLFPFALLAP
jgi:hypothetical protein